jgi:Transmembrane secretion effector
MSSASLLPGPLHVRRSFQGSSSIYFDDFEVDRTRGKEFLEAMREVRLIHLRNGAFSWRLHEDLNRLNTYRIEVMVPSWTEYLLEHERMTTGEQKIVDKAWALHVGANPPETRYFLCVNRELHTRHYPMTRPSAMPEAPLSVDRVDS